MTLAHSKVTSQGQISVPAEVRKKLGVGPGSIIEWADTAAGIVVRRAGRVRSEDIHAAIFGGRTPKARSVRDLKAGIRKKMKSKHARR
jgi:AbrB family looped-hinge helix DNA binding protein